MFGKYFFIFMLNIKDIHMFSIYDNKMFLVFNKIHFIFAMSDK